MIVRLDGEIDCATGPGIAAGLVQTMSESGADLVADLADVSFLDGAGLGALVLVRHFAAERGLRFRVTRPSRAVGRVLEAVDPRVVDLLPAPTGGDPGPTRKPDEQAPIAADPFCPRQEGGKVIAMEDRAAGSRS